MRNDIEWLFDILEAIARIDKNSQRHQRVSIGFSL